MAVPKPPEDGKRRGKPPTTPEEREDELVDLAYGLAYKQLVAGTASSQIIVKMLQLGSSRERLEQQQIEHNNELAKVRMESLQSQAKSEEMFAEAIRAMTKYQGHEEAPDALDDF